MARQGGSLFLRIAQAIEDSIATGIHPTGGRLPTEAELSARHNVSRHTIREALSELRQRGLIESRQGVGSVVVRQRPAMKRTETYSSIDELTRQAAGSPIKVDSIEEVAADATLAADLDCRVNQSFLRIVGRRYHPDDRTMPIGHVVVHVDATYGRIRDAVWDLEKSIVETIEDIYGIAVAKIVQELTVDRLPGELAGPLKAEPDSPVLKVRRRYISDAGRSFEIADSVFPMGRFVYRTELTR